MMRGKVFERVIVFFIYVCVILYRNRAVLVSLTIREEETKKSKNTLSKKE